MHRAISPSATSRSGTPRLPGGNVLALGTTALLDDRIETPWYRCWIAGRRQESVRIFGEKCHEDGCWPFHRYLLMFGTIPRCKRPNDADGNAPNVRWSRWRHRCGGFVSVG